MDFNPLKNRFHGSVVLWLERKVVQALHWSQAGDPLSPMLFILAMEPLQRMFDVVATDGLLSPLMSKPVALRVSLYANDADVFIKPMKEDDHVVAQILVIFGRASGLVVNKEKYAVFPIQCDGVNLAEVMESFNFLV